MENCLNNNLEKLSDEYNQTIQVGADAKRLQYDHYAEDLCYDKINITNILNNHHFKNTNNTPQYTNNESNIESNMESNDESNMNVVMINIEKDKVRYYSAIKELEKVSVYNFVHLKATYWKEKDKMLNDLKMVLSFLSNFNSNLNQSSIPDIHINDFSEINDPLIQIQDGPLACYISHLRAMIYGYLNFKDYTIVVEDDISISNTRKIETYLKEIPEDWDIICMNSMPLNVFYNQPFYKYQNTFHSAHFYIIKNKIMPTLFENLYPIPDQVDILLARLYNTINIYNIEDTVYQKNFSTNTQNNLNAIFNGPSYQPIRDRMLLTRNYIYDYVNDILKNNSEERNQLITSNIYSDIIYNHIINNFSYQKSNYVSENKPDITLSKYENEYTHINDDIFKTKSDFFKNIYQSMYLVINCVVKGKDIHNETFDLTERISTLIQSFTLHNTIDLEFNEPIKAYNYGSTSNVYLLEQSNMIIKVYNNYLRWTCPGHDNINDIFEKEVNILERLSLLHSVDLNNKIIKMKYLGLSLYDHFYLPNDWKNQLENLFNEMNLKDITYPEFNLKNILVLNDKIHLIDYGLSNVNNRSNHNNYLTFIEILEKINNKYQELDNSNNLFFGNSNLLLNNLEMKKIYYKTLIANSTLMDKYIGNIF